MRRQRSQPPCTRLVCVASAVVASLVLLLLYSSGDDSSAAGKVVTALRSLRAPSVERGAFDLADPCSWPSWSQPLPMQVCVGMAACHSKRLR
jgi:hypothetical protein